MSLQNPTRDALTVSDFLERIQLVLKALREGDLSPRSRPWNDPLCDAVGREMNQTLQFLSTMLSEVNRVQYEVGMLGQLGPTAEVDGAAGDWRRLVDLTNQWAHGQTNQIRNFIDVITALEAGRFTPRADVPCHGELRQLRDAINRLLARFGSEPGMPLPASVGDDHLSHVVTLPDAELLGPCADAAD